MLIAFYITLHSILIVYYICSIDWKAGREKKNWLINLLYVRQAFGAPVLFK